MKPDKHLIFGRLLILPLLFSVGSLLSSCDEKQGSDYRVNATIMPDDDQSQDEKKSEE